MAPDRALRHLIVLVLLGLTTALGVFVLAASIRTSYQASATLAVQQFTSDSSIAPALGLSAAAVSRNERGAPYLINGDTGLAAIAANVAARLPTRTPAQVKDSVSISDTTDIDTTIGRIYANADLRILSVNAVADSPRLAAVTATDFAREFLSYRQALIARLFQLHRSMLTSRLESARGTHQDAATRASLVEQLTQLSDLAGIEAGQVRFRTPASQPRSRVGPYATRDAVVAALLVPLMAFLVSLLTAAAPRNGPRPKSHRHTQSLTQAGV